MHKHIKKYWLTVSAIFCCMLTSYGQDVIYTSQKSNNDNLYVINSRGQKIAITNHSRKDSSPVISPDGKYIVFTSERVGWWKIWLMTIKDKSFKQLSSSSYAAYSPSWSPDGKLIVYVTTDKGSQEIFTMKPNGEQQVNLTNNKKDDITPSWGKDGKIYYSTKHNEFYQIARMNPDGSEKEIITKDNCNKLMPQLSNNGNTLLYYGDKYNNMEIFSYNLDTKIEKRLTNNPLVDRRARWSFDDKKIVFERGNKGNNHHIYIMDFDGSNAKQLTSSGYNYAPSFVPNSTSFKK
ncbi:TolB family protein [Pontimicrobium aquaticum]|uniref:DUF5050 domain-containing protein n=1 Tax=Pontimicrobium aquaticum TaxID=2565367 RepID=A0A4U0EMX5_9FLAO|nr:DUF5050 domain-containing protein [Pontimicrobium aquaticum]TJY32943.1 DUF5050 domain-containing protein [Pontimicrobium aquaticum]